LGSIPRPSVSTKVSPTTSLRHFWIRRASVVTPSAQAGRDVENSYRCPADVVGQQHHDGRIAGGALWSCAKKSVRRSSIKPCSAAAIAFSNDTNFETAANAIIDEVKALAPEKEGIARNVFIERGLMGCDRVLDYAPINAQPGQLSVQIPSGQQLAPTVRPLFVGDKIAIPSFVQHRVKLAETTKEVTIEWAASASAGSFGGIGGAGEVTLGIALKKGSAAITYDYSSGQAVSDAHLILDGQKEGGITRVVLSGACVAKGDLVFQLINRGETGGALTKLTVTQSDTVTNSKDNFTACP
jgi:hypothetical protein